MERHTKLIDLELEKPGSSIQRFDGYDFLQVLVRLHGSPIGTVRVPLKDGECSLPDLMNSIISKLEHPIITHLLCDWISNLPQLQRIRIADVITSSHPRRSEQIQPSVTVAICTRNRAEDLAICLDSLQKLEYPPLEILVVDNAPDNNATSTLVKKYPEIRYVMEPRPGLNWARNRAVAESRGEIIAFIDDDAAADPEWVKMLSSVFAEDPGVSAVTGLVIPYELETEAQELFEQYGGFGRGYVKKWYRADCCRDGKLASIHGGPGKFGTGANMAFRRAFFEKIGPFDPALDVGTVTNGGGDLEIFFRVLKEDGKLVYEPNAIVRHRHRRDYADLRKQIRNWGIGFSSYLVRSALAYPDERLAFVKLWIGWIKNKVRCSIVAAVRPSVLRDLIYQEFQGLMIGTLRYHKAVANVSRIRKLFGPPEFMWNNVVRSENGRKKIASIRILDLSKPIEPIQGMSDYASAEFLITWKDAPLGTVEVPSRGDILCPTQIREAIVDQLYLRLLDPDFALSDPLLLAEIRETLRNQYLVQHETAHQPATRKERKSGTAVSIIIATYDRPDDLRVCLGSLAGQKSQHKIEIIVVDNNPASGLTPPVTESFPQVTLVSEYRKGLSYARNRGITASIGEIVVSTDDDVTVSPGWIDKLVAPFERPDVMVVTGNVLPGELETHAQFMFEQYGGLARGFEPLEAGKKWFEGSLRAVPTWKLGSTANAAFRATIFNDPRIGLLDESLGAGTPTGCSEDTYLFYKVLKAGYTIMYQPTAYVWHRHRRTMPALTRQIYNYSKGHVAYHLKTLIIERDLRSLNRLIRELPQYHLQKIRGIFRGNSKYPIRLLFAEMMGHLAGPFALYQSMMRVRKLGRSKAYVPSVKYSGKALPEDAGHSSQMNETR